MATRGIKTSVIKVNESCDHGWSVFSDNLRSLGGRETRPRDICTLHLYLLHPKINSEFVLFLLGTGI